MILGIELASAGLRAASSADPSVPLLNVDDASNSSPAVAILETRGKPLVGRAAELRFKIARSADVVEGWWQGDHNGSVPRNVSPAALARHQLENVFNVIGSAPGARRPSHVAAAVGELPAELASAEGWKKLWHGILDTPPARIDAALAAGLGHGAAADAGNRRRIIWVDAGRHVLWLTTVENDGISLRVTGRETVADFGEVKLKERLVDALADTIKARTGRIPIQGRADAQTMFDQIDACLETLHEGRAARIGVEGASTEIDLGAVERRLGGAWDGLTAAAAQIVSRERAQSPCFVISRRVARFPGIIAAFQAIADAAIEQAPDECVARGAARYAEAIAAGAVSSADALETVTLGLLNPGAPAAVSPPLVEKPAVARVVRPSGRPSRGATLHRTGPGGILQRGEHPDHLLFQGRVVPLGSETFHVGGGVSDQRNGLHLHELTGKIADLQFSVEPLEAGWRLVPKAGVMINGARAAESVPLRIGDIIEIESSGVLFVAVRGPVDAEARR